MRIGVDLMGGDTPPKLLFPAVVRVAEELPPDLSVLVLTTPDFISSFSLMTQSLPSALSRRISFHSCDQVIAMDDSPLSAVRTKKQASLIVGMHLLKESKIDALVSCGNTGALIAGAALILSPFPGGIQPALLATLPTKKGPLAVIDVGGSLSDQAEHLVQCALLGVAYQQIMQGLDSPRVGLLNIGFESGKGNVEVRKAYEQLSRLGMQSASLNGSSCWQFTGNVEGRDVFHGDVDVLVTDGFSGNILLKTSEGVASLIFDVLQQEVKEKGLTLEESTFFVALMTQLKKQFNYAEYPGALVCGVEGVVIKAHGNATAESLFMSVIRARDCLQKQVIAHMKNKR
jgi:phosphate acyltransferase